MRCRADAAALPSEEAFCPIDGRFSDVAREAADEEAGGRTE